MSISFSIAKMLITDQIKDKINIQINNIQESCGWNKFVIGIPPGKIKIFHSSYVEVLSEKDVWEELAKVSIDLWIDYDHYRRFNFESQYGSKEHADRLANLGLECHGGQWQSVRKPTVDEVQMNVFMFCLYRAISAEMELEEIHQNNENERRQRDASVTDVNRSSTANSIFRDTSEKEDAPSDNVVQKFVGNDVADVPILCSFCDSEIVRGENICGVCDALIEENEEFPSKSEEGCVVQRSPDDTAGLLTEPCEDTPCCKRSVTEDGGPVMSGNVREVGKGSPEGEIVSDTNDSQALWQCLSCTYRNAPNCQTCAVCFTDKLEVYSLPDRKGLKNEPQGTTGSVRECEGEKREPRNDGMFRYFRPTSDGNRSAGNFVGKILDSDSDAREQSRTSRNKKKLSKTKFQRPVKPGPNYRSSDDTRDADDAQFGQTDRYRGMERGPAHRPNLAASFSNDNYTYQRPFSYNYEENVQPSRRSQYRRNYED